MRITLDVSENCESTAEPWWFIVDPVQNLRCSVSVAARQITGPFFSREEGESFLRRASHHFTKRAIVWCASGCDARQYATAIREARRASAEGRPA